MLTTGVDLVDIPRIERAVSRFGERFLARVFTPDEVRYSQGRTAELAARFAAKEAVGKALGVGMRVLSPAGIGWLEVETLNETSGKPYIILHGRARELAEAQELTEWAISLSHDKGIAIAFVAALAWPAR
ncbi:MAG TPA: holo-ACP synthase [Anaerolineae bacterium]|nr:holo-ACP synthase [Anaerolineae bacterium]HQI83713.1 holo-ACP synthase [Anaerolineae bacterium]